MRSPRRFHFSTCSFFYILFPFLLCLSLFAFWNECARSLKSSGVFAFLSLRENSQTSWDIDEPFFSAEKLRELGGAGVGYLPMNWTADPADPFNRTNVLDSRPDEDWNSNLSSVISDYGAASDNCLGSNRHKKKERDATLLFKFWNSIAREEDIPYFLFYGSLLGYLRNKTITPYDKDIDVAVPSWAYNRLRRYATPMPLRSHVDEGVGFTVLLHSDFASQAPMKRKLWNCRGESTLHFDDRCAYSVLLGRVFFGDVYMDIYAADYLQHYDKVVVREFKNTILEPELIFPLRHCTYLGLPSFCPNQSLLITRFFYSNRQAVSASGVLEGLTPLKFCSQVKAGAVDSSGLPRPRGFYWKDIAKNASSVIWMDRFGVDEWNDAEKRVEYGLTLGDQKERIVQLSYPVYCAEMKMIPADLPDCIEG